MHKNIIKKTNPHWKWITYGKNKRISIVEIKRWNDVKWYDKSTRRSTGMKVPETKIPDEDKVNLGCMMKVMMAKVEAMKLKI